MKISLCIAGDTKNYSLELRVGYQIEVDNIPRIGETIKLKSNLFDYIFEPVNSYYKKDILFIDSIVEGKVVDVVHGFKAMGRPMAKMFQGNNKSELLSAINSDSDFELKQIVFVVIKFQKAK